MMHIAAPLTFVRITFRRMEVEEGGRVGRGVIHADSSRKETRRDVVFSVCSFLASGRYATGWSRVGNALQKM